MLYPKDLSKMGVFLTVAGDPIQVKGGMTIAKLQNVVVMYETGMNTDDGTKIWEGDIIDAGVMTEFGSMLPARGYMQWNKVEGKWFLYIPNPPVMSPIGNFPVMGQTVVGNVYEHPHMLKEAVSHETSS